MNRFTLTQTHNYSHRSRYVVELLDQQDVMLSKGTIHLMQTAFGDEFLKTLSFSGVVTPMQYRRQGHVREIFDYAWQWGIEHEAVVSLLHPFSFSYYQKFGYGKVADHLIVRCPIRMLEFVPRCGDFEKFEESEANWQQLYDLHNEFCRGRLLTMLRCDPQFYKGKEIYVYREGGQPAGYIAYTTEKKLMVNHYEEGLMTVHEIVYKTPSALKAILGFIRMYDGELEDVEFANIAMCPEVELQLRHYTHTRYRLLPDLMARVLDTEKMLLAHTYPQQEGAFRIRVEDRLPTVQGSFLVEYGGGSCQVKRLGENAAVDMTVDSPSLSRLLYGYDAVTPQQAAYCDGISIDGNADDFFRAFGKRPAGMFEHF